MNKWIMRNWKVLLLLFIGIVIGPLVINVLFKMQAPISLLVAEWNASAALAYYGALVAAVIAVYGVFLTIRYSQQNYKEDVRNRALPFIVIDMLKSKSYNNLLGEEPQPEENGKKGYYEYKLQDYYCILENGNINYTTGLTKGQQDLLDNGGVKWASKSNGRSMVVIDYICVPIEIENVGNGTAIRLRYGLNRKNVVEKERKFLPTISLKQSMPILFHIFSEDCARNSANLGKYVLSFYYDDIFSNKYRQNFDISIEYDDKTNRPVALVDMGHIQDFLGGKSTWIK
jgi:hypothetical protein